MADGSVFTRKRCFTLALNPEHDNTKYPKMCEPLSKKGRCTAGLTMEKISCFKAYDVRGRVPGELNEDWLIGSAGLMPRSCLRPGGGGRDVRFSSLPLTVASPRDSTRRAEVWDLGLCGTEQIYFATSHLGLDGGIMVTASHNPPEYNGMKFVRGESRPLSGTPALKRSNAWPRPGLAALPQTPGGRKDVDCLADYVAHLLSYIDPRL